MRTSRFDEVVAGRHRKTRDRGFSLVEVAAAAAVVTGVVASGGVLVANLGGDDDRVQVADLSAASGPVAEVAAQVAPVVQKPAAVLEAPVLGPVAQSRAKHAKPAAPVVPKAVCSATKGNVSLKVDALVHALGAEGGTVRSEAAETKVVARPAKGNPCTKKVTLFMGENYAFEGALPYGNWILDLGLSGSKKAVKLAVDGPVETVPTQLLDGDCGGTAAIAVKTVTADSILGLSGALPGTKVIAKRVPDGECAIPAETSFVTGAGGSYTGTIGYGDWMFSIDSPAGGVAEFVTVGKNTDKVVLTQAANLLG